jgi:hypothetical protein
VVDKPLSIICSGEVSVCNAKSMSIVVCKAITDPSEAWGCACLLIVSQVCLKCLWGVFAHVMHPGRDSC